MKRLLSILLASAMLLAVVFVASCNKPVETTAAETTAEPVTPVAADTYTYKDAVGTLATNWNPHTYQTADDGYPASFLRTGLYDFIFNDELNPVEGKEPYAGYKIIPEMASAMPVDVTEEVKVSNPEFGIPESATSGFAYKIELNKNAVWENGEKINADTYVYSMKRLLDPELLNYRAQDYISGSFVIANGPDYYYQGSTAYLPIGTMVSDYLAQGGKVEDLYINAYDFWNADASYTDEAGNALPQYVSVLDETVYGENVGDAFSGASLYTDYIGPGCDYEDYSVDDICVPKEYAADFSFDNVGVKKIDEYTILLVLSKSLAGFNLLYNLGANWIVNETLYEANLSKIGETDAWASTYNTSVETTLSYGPYKLVSYQKDKSMKFEKNENWYGYTDGRHKYVDPEDGKTYDFYQTTTIDTQVVAEAATRKLMFLKGQLMTYGLQAEDVAEYRNSDYCLVSPSETIFFWIFNGYADQINQREANEGFDTSKYDLQTLTVKAFRKAMAVTYDKEALCTALFPDCSPGFGIVGNMYIYDPDTGAKYRDTDVAKQTLCDFYSVDVSKFDSLDEAVDSITGYDPETAKVLFKEAFDEALEKGYITDADNDGKSDQVIRIEYCCSSEVTERMQKRIDFLNEKANDVAKGTPFEGKIEFYPSAPYGNDWSDKIRGGLSDCILAGWSGSALDPFSLSDLYTNPSRAYDANWFQATKVQMTMKIGEEEITMSLKNWSDALNGTTVKDVAGVERNYGAGQVDIEVRLAVLAKIEGEVLQTYDYLPAIQDGSLFLLTQQAYYVIEDYNPILGRGGIAYLKYNYTDAEWDAYVASQADGKLSY